jgi:hypothetical protein
MSSSHFGDLGCIVENRAGLVRLAAEPFVLECGRHDQVDSTTKHVREGLLEILQPAEPGTEVVIGRVFDQEIDVAAIGVEIRCTDGAKDFEPGDAVFLGEGADGFEVVCNERDRG